MHEPKVIIDALYSEQAEHWPNLHAFVQFVRSHACINAVPFSISLDTAGDEVTRNLEKLGLPGSSAINSFAAVLLPNHFVHVLDSLKQSYLNERRCISYNGRGANVYNGVFHAPSDISLKFKNPDHLRIGRAGSVYCAFIAVNRFLLLGWEVDWQDCEATMAVGMSGGDDLRPFDIYTDEEKKILGEDSLHHPEPFYSFVEYTEWPLTSE